MNAKGKTRVALACVALGAGVAVVLLGHFGKQRGPSPKPASAKEAPAKQHAGAGNKASARAKVSNSRGAGAHALTGRVARASSLATNRADAAAQAQPRTDDERKASAMRELLDSGDERGALKAARELMVSPDENVRSSVVTVLGWIGLKALPELTEMLADGSESVADEALTQWKMAFGEIQDDAAKAELLVAAVQTIQKPEEQEALVLDFSQLPEGLAIRSLSQIIQGGNKAASDVARDQAEFIMGEPYTTDQAALAWANNKDREETAPQ